MKKSDQILQADDGRADVTMHTGDTASIFRRISRFVLGPNQDGVELEQRLFTITMLLVGCAGLASFVENSLLGFNLSLQIVTIVIAIVFVILWLFARSGKPFTILIYPSAVGLVVLLSVAWVYNGGSRGGANLFLLVAPLALSVFSKGVGRVVLLGVYSIMIVFLFMLEYVNPHLITGYASESDRLIDVSVSLFISLVLSITFILTIHSGYRKAVKKANVAKAASDARFFETADMLPVMICETGRDLSISFINRAGSDLTGYAQGELGHDHTVLDIIHADDVLRAEREFTQTLSGEHLPLQEYRIVRKDGKAVRALLQCNHVLAENGVAGLRMCFVDITEQKTLEEQYRQAQKMESVGLLAGGVAHDFNNILSAILGYATLIKIQNSARERDAFGEKLDEQISSILKAGDRATDLVRKLLAFSRQGSYEVNPVNVHSLIDEVTALLAHSIDKRITIAKNLTALSPVVSGDQALLQSALLNLAINARDAMPGGGTLTFSTKGVTVDKLFIDRRTFAIAPGSYVAVTVADNGVGIDENVKKHLFEPFFTTKEPGKGTGLGLASVFGTVKRHGGFIEVQSEKGKGAAMTFYLPQADVKTMFETAAPGTRKPGRPLHVLVVDDESMICDFVKEYLAAEGYRATTFTNPQEAVDWYRRSYADVDCIVLDMNMPVMDGKACFSAMRRINPQAKGIFSTGFMVGDTAAIIRLPGIRGYVQKPFSLEGLVETIVQAVDGDEV